MSTVAAEEDRELRLAPESIETLAVRLAELLRPEGPEGDDDLISAAEVARRYGVRRRWVYENKDFLGAVELGTGPRPRLRFDPRFLDRRLGPADWEGNPRAADTRRSSWIRAAHLSDSLSSRTRANVTRPSEFMSGAARERPPDVAPDRGRGD
jgi:hypothetical protein